MKYRFFQWKNHRGLTLRGSLHIAKPASTPWVIFCHGFTGQRMGPGYLFVKIAQKLADCGISSLRFDFCGSGESDGSFSDMTVPTMEQDLIFISGELQSRYSPSQLILLGHSLGGMITAMHAGSLKAQGLILLSPVGDPEGLIHRRKDLLETGSNSAGFYENGPHEMSIIFLEALKKINPVKQFSSTFKGNLLLFQGDDDQSITVDESLQYIRSLQGTRLNCEYRLIEGADHNYSKVSHVKTVLSTVCAWTKEHFS